MPGLIEQVLKLGLERRELIKDHPNALIGGARIPFPPKDMAGVVSVLKGITVKTVLAFENETNGGLRFLAGHLHPLNVVEAGQLDEKALRKFLRTLKEPADLITLDGRGLSLPADVIWRYLCGGREPYKPAFATGAPVDYGAPKIRPGGYLVINLADAGAKEVWFRARAIHAPVFQSPFVGVVRVAST